MLLRYYDIPYNYDRLVRLLGIQRPYGTAFPNIGKLANQKIAVAYRQGTIAGLHAHLVNGDPCIASVQTGQLPYWNKLNTYHVVVVVGMSVILFTSTIQQCQWLHCKSPSVILILLGLIKMNTMP